MIRKNANILVVALIIAAAAFSPLRATDPPKSAKAKPLHNSGTPDTLNWRNYGNDLQNRRYQDVDQINTTNAGSLKVAWVFHTGVLDQFATLQASPIVIGGTMYVTDGHDDVFALDAATGVQRWAYKPLDTGDLQPLETLPLCCGRNNRGVAAGDGKVFYGRMDAAAVALNATTGAVVWKHALASPSGGYSITMAPQFVTTTLHPKGLVIISLAGAEFEARGQVFALDARTGSTVWHTFTTQDPKTWGGNAFLHGGAMVWNTPSIDTGLGLVYINTGNPAPDLLGQDRPGDNHFSDSLVALDLNTGNIIWFFQEVHHDLWDYDASQTTVLFDVTRNGKTLPAIGHCGKTGNYYILDRRNGNPIFPITEVPVPTIPAFQNPSPTQPLSSVGHLTPLTFVKPNDSGVPSAPIYTPPQETEFIIQPGAQGGCEWPAAAFSPRTHFVYYGARYQPTTFQSAPNNTSTFTLPGQDPPVTLGSAFARGVPGTNPFGIFGATNVNTGEVAWSINTPQPATSGMLVAGDVVFFGETNGQFHGVNASTGEMLFTFNGPSQITNAGGAAAGPIAYVVNGKEFVANAFGGNALDRFTGQPSPVGDAIIAFTLP